MVGYARVSTSDQNNQRQIDELVKAGVAAIDIFSDTASGRTMARQGWRDCWRDLESGDILVVHAGDRLGRDLVEVMTVLRDLHQKGIHLKILTMDLDTRTPVGRLAFSVMATFAQFERELMLERTKHGLQKARERGVVGGAKKRFTDTQIEGAVRKFGVNGAARALKASKTTIVRRMKIIEDNRAQEAQKP